MHHSFSQRSAPASATPFTAVLCRHDDCRVPDGLDVIGALRASIRRCPHGVLAIGGCLVGAVSCRTRQRRPDSGGAMVVVGPCDTDRAATGPPILVGPLRCDRDVRLLCSWLEQGDLRPALLPRHILGVARVRQPTASN